VLKNRLIFLHFARKTFNPWAGLKTDSRSGARDAGRHVVVSRCRRQTARGGRGTLSSGSGLRRASTAIWRGNDCGYKKTCREYAVCLWKRPDYEGRPKTSPNVQIFALQDFFAAIAVA